MATLALVAWVTGTPPAPSLPESSGGMGILATMPAATTPAASPTLPGEAATLQPQLAATRQASPTAPPSPTPSATPLSPPEVAPPVGPSPTQEAVATRARIFRAIIAVEEGSANVRTGPGLAYRVFAAGFDGESYTVTGRDSQGEWIQLCCWYWGEPGWVFVALLEIEGDVGDIPIVENIPPPDPDSSGE